MLALSVTIWIFLLLSCAAMGSDNKAIPIWFQSTAQKYYYFDDFGWAEHTWIEGHLPPPSNLSLSWNQAIADIWWGAIIFSNLSVYYHNVFYWDITKRIDEQLHNQVLQKLY